jgi:hypothetical protein
MTVLVTLDQGKNAKRKRINDASMTYYSALIER